jgi:hypothetical protein
MQQLMLISYNLVLGDPNVNAWLDQGVVSGSKFVKLINTPNCATLTSYGVLRYCFLTFSFCCDLRMTCKSQQLILFYLMLFCAITRRKRIRNVIYSLDATHLACNFREQFLARSKSFLFACQFERKHTLCMLL